MQPLAELPFVAGHVALDFVNTAEERGHPDAGDVLRSADDLRLWGIRRGVLAPGAGRGAGTPELPAALEARELLYRLFLDRVHGEPTPRAKLDRLGRLASSAYRAATLGQASDGPLGWTWDPAE